MEYIIFVIANVILIIFIYAERGARIKELEEQNKRLTCVETGAHIKALEKENKRLIYGIIHGFSLQYFAVGIYRAVFSIKFGIGYIKDFEELGNKIVVSFQDYEDDQEYINKNGKYFNTTFKDDILYASKTLR